MWRALEKFSWPTISFSLNSDWGLDDVSSVIWLLVLVSVCLSLSWSTGLELVVMLLTWTMLVLLLNSSTGLEFVVLLFWMGSGDGFLLTFWTSVIFDCCVLFCSLSVPFGDIIFSFTRLTLASVWLFLGSSVDWSTSGLTSPFFELDSPGLVTTEAVVLVALFSPSVESGFYKET